MSMTEEQLPVSIERHPYQALFELGPALASLLKELRIPRARLAERIGVSLNTVDNWCSGKKKIALDHLDVLATLLHVERASEEKIDSIVMWALQAHGLSERWVRHDRPAGLLPLSNTFVFVGATREPYVTPTVTRVVRGVFNERGLPLLTLDFSGQAVPGGLFASVLASRPRGAMLTSLSSQELLNSVAQSFSEHSIPAVYIYGRPAKLPPRSGGVYCNDEELGFMAGQLLTRAGHTRIGFVTLSPGYIGERRRLGYHRALTEAGIKPDASWTLALSRIEDRSATKAEVFDMIARERITGLLAADTIATEVVLEVCRERGISWPRDISLVGIGWLGEIQAGSGPRLTFVEVPLTSMARTAADILIRLGLGRLSPSASEWRQLPSHGFQFRNLENGSVLHLGR